MSSTKSLSEILAEKKNQGKKTRSTSGSVRSISSAKSSKTQHDQSFTPPQVRANMRETKTIPEADLGSTPALIPRVKTLSEFVAERSARSIRARSAAGSIRSGGSGMTSQSVLDELANVSKRQEETEQAIKRMEEMMKEMLLKK